MIDQIGRQPDPAVFKPQLVFGKPAHGLRVDLVFLNQNAGGQRRFIVAIEHRHGSLDDDRAMIQLGRDEMHRATVDPHTFFKRPLMRVQTGEGWQQRRVDVEQATFVMTHEIGRQNAHETSQHDQIGCKTVDAFSQRGIEGFAPGKCLVVDVMRCDSCLGGRLQTFGIRPVADHGSDIDRQIAGIAGGDQRFHIAATAGNQDDDILHFKKLTGKKIVLTTV